jgi:hypothetical protein
MTTPATPLRLQVIDRIVAVLQGISTGATYFYTPGEVAKRFIHWSECKAFPTYMVFTASGGKVELSGAAGDDSEYTEDFYVSIKGIVKDSVDTVTKLERCIADIRKAIDADSRSGAAGSLGVLAVETRIEDSPETDDGYLSLEGMGFFDQKIRVSIAGVMGV